MKIKISMTNGKEYFVNGSVEKIVNAKNSTNNGFVEITDYRCNNKVTINVNAISSIEPFNYIYREPEWCG